MKVSYTDKGKPWEEGAAVLQPFTEILEEAIGASAASLKPELKAELEAEWDRTQDEQDRTLYYLRLTADNAAATALFEPDELQRKNRVRMRILAVWGDVLRQLLDSSWKRIREMDAVET
jgi:hypothetical protein